MFQIQRHIFRYIIFLLGLCVSTELSAQDEWQSVMLKFNGKSIVTTKAIGVRAIALAGDNKMDAYILLFGGRANGNYNLGVVLNKLNEIVPNSEIDEFRPPDLSDKVVNADAMNVCILKGNKMECFGMPMNMYSCLMLPDTIRGKANEFFVSSVMPKYKRAWHNYLARFEAGYDDGYVIVGDGFFQKPIKIAFSGKGMGPRLKELIEFVGN